MQIVWILQSLYQQDDDKQPINWATAVFATEELARRKMAEIKNTRTDIKEVYIRSHFVQGAAGIRVKRCKE